MKYQISDFTATRLFLHKCAVKASLSYIFAFNLLMLQYYALLNTVFGSVSQNWKFSSHCCGAMSLFICIDRKETNSSFEP